MEQASVWISLDENTPLSFIHRVTVLPKKKRERIEDKTPLKICRSLVTYFEKHTYTCTHTHRLSHKLAHINKCLEEHVQDHKTTNIQTDQKRETLDLGLTGYNTPICRVTCDTISFQATRTTLWMKHLPFIYQAISAASSSPCDSCPPLSVSVRRVGFQR